MPQLDFNLVFINFLTVIVFFIIFYLFSYFFLMRKVFSVFMLRKFILIRITNRVNSLAVVKKINAEVVTDIQTQTIKLFKKID